MPEVDFLELSDVTRIRTNQTAIQGDECEIRDVSLLESAIELPRASVDGVYLHAFRFEMAAAYLFHIVMTIRSSVGTNGLVLQQRMPIVFGCESLTSVPLALPFNRNRTASFRRQVAINQGSR